MATNLNIRARHQGDRRASNPMAIPGAASGREQSLTTEEVYDIALPLSVQLGDNGFTLNK